jgi:hypothetical protein
MDCWRREIGRSRTEAEVVRNAVEFMALWSPRELAPVARGCRVDIHDAADLERVSKWVVEDLPAVAPPDAAPLRELGEYLWYAAARIREIRHC